MTIAGLFAYLIATFISVLGLIVAAGSGQLLMDEKFGAGNFGFVVAFAMSQIGLVIVALVAS